jgi:hypothetical protein
MCVCSPIAPLRHRRARLLRHGRRAASCVLSCAGAYVAGAAGSNACPAGSARIVTADACRTAVTAAGKTAAPTLVETNSDFPRGCYYTTANNFAWFNTHAVGGGNSASQPLCAATVATGAPPHTPLTPTRVCCAVLAGVASYNANGLNIDPHAYMSTHIYTHMSTNCCCAHCAWAILILFIQMTLLSKHTYTYTHSYTRIMATELAGGAARRTAALADGGRQTGVQKLVGYYRRTVRGSCIGRDVLHGGSGAAVPQQRSAPRRAWVWARHDLAG